MQTQRLRLTDPCTINDTRADVAPVLPIHLSISMRKDLSATTISVSNLHNGPCHDRSHAQSQCEVGAAGMSIRDSLYPLSGFPDGGYQGSGPLFRDESVLDRVADQLRVVAEIELLHEPHLVRADGLGAQRERFGDVV